MRQVFPPVALPYHINSKVSNDSGNLGNARGLYHRGTLLAVGKARSFVFVGVYTTKFFAVCVGDGDQPVMMLAAAVFIEGGFVCFCRVFGGAFCHGSFPVLDGSDANYRKLKEQAQVPREVVTGFSAK